MIPGQEPVITLGPVNVTATYTLSCSVANEGLYVWEWTLPSGVTQHTALSADGTRTSFLELTQMSTQYEGEYTCAVRYESEQTVSNSSVTELKLEGRYTYLLLLLQKYSIGKFSCYIGHCFYCTSSTACLTLTSL